MPRPLNHPHTLLGPRQPSNLQAIPFANFGTQPAKVIANRLLGHIEPLQENHVGPRIVEDMHMARVFLGETDLGDNQPCVLHKDRDDDFDVESADISPNGGDEYQNQMGRIIGNHSHLFRPGKKSRIGSRIWIFNDFPLREGIGEYGSRPSSPLRFQCMFLLEQRSLRT